MFLLLRIGDMSNLWTAVSDFERCCSEKQATCFFLLDLIDPMSNAWTLHNLGRMLSSVLTNMPKVVRNCAVGSGKQATR